MGWEGISGCWVLNPKPATLTLNPKPSTLFKVERAQELGCRAEGLGLRGGFWFKGVKF